MKVHKITAGFDYEKRPNEFLDLWDIVNQKQMKPKSLKRSELSKVTKFNWSAPGSDLNKFHEVN